MLQTHLCLVGRGTMINQLCLAGNGRRWPQTSSPFAPSILYPFTLELILQKPMKGQRIYQLGKTSLQIQHLIHSSWLTVLSQVTEHVQMGHYFNCFSFNIAIFYFSFLGISAMTLTILFTWTQRCKKYKPNWVYPNWLLEHHPLSLLSCDHSSHCSETIRHFLQTGS